MRILALFSLAIAFGTISSVEEPQSLQGMQEVVVFTTTDTVTTTTTMTTTTTTVLLEVAPTDTDKVIFSESVVNLAPTSLAVNVTIALPSVSAAFNQSVRGVTNKTLITSSTGLATSFASLLASPLQLTAKKPISKVSNVTTAVATQLHPKSLNLSTSWKNESSIATSSHKFTRSKTSTRITIVVVTPSPKSLDLSPRWKNMSLATSNSHSASQNITGTGISSRFTKQSPSKSLALIPPWRNASSIVSDFHSSQKNVTNTRTATNAVPSPPYKSLILSTHRKNTSFFASNSHSSSKDLASSRVNTVVTTPLSSKLLSSSLRNAGSDLYNSTRGLTSTLTTTIIVTPLCQSSLGVSLLWKNTSSVTTKLRNSTQGPTSTHSTAVSVTALYQSSPNISSSNTRHIGSTFSWTSSRNTTKPLSVTRALWSASTLQANSSSWSRKHGSTLSTLTLVTTEFQTQVVTATTTKLRTITFLSEQLQAPFVAIATSNP